jgi:CBS domain-containing protein
MIPPDTKEDDMDLHDEQTVRGLGTVGEAMTGSVLTIEPGWSLGRAALELERGGVSGAPVVDDGVLVGVVTLRDMLRTGGATEESPIATTGPWLRHEHQLDRSGQVVADAMSRTTVTIGAGASVAEAADLMQRAHVNRIPVTDQGKRVVGILTRDDIVAAVARVATRSAEVQRPQPPAD